jgi:hypothetical protein
MMSRFCRYIEKIFDFGQTCRELKDSRKRPQISTLAVWTSAFFLFVTGRKSLNAMEGQLRIPRRMEALIGSRKPSADTMGRVMNLLPPEQLEALLSRYNHRLRRNKALEDNPWPLRFVALDGHEFFSLLPRLVPAMLDANRSDRQEAGHSVLPQGCCGTARRL